jgi:hypothetical protein
MSYSRTSNLIILFLICIATLAQDATAQPISFSRSDRDLAIDPFQIVTADFNNDGKLDLALTDKVQPELLVVLGNGDGTFSSEVPFSTVGPVTSLVSADFNHDDNPDLAMAVPSRSSVVILFGTGDGNFSPALELPNSTGGSFFGVPLGLTAGDFDNDGTQDLMIIGLGSNVIEFLKSNGDGTFGPYTVAGHVRDDPLDIISADFNNDGNLDIATANFDSFGVTVAAGSGDGTLQPVFEIPTTGAGAIALTAGDLNQDGFPDLGFVHPAPRVPGTFTLMLGNGDVTFGPGRINVSTGFDPRDILMGDFNLDGDLDVVVAHFLDHLVSPLVGTQDQFQVGSTFNLIFSNFENPIALAAGDFNNDCRLDLAVLTAGNGALSIFLNTVPKPPFDIVDVALSTDVLWPPNHKMVDVMVEYSTTNNCGAATCSLSVSSNEPVNGKGDGGSAADWEIVDEHHVRLRAKRAGNRSERIYTITITCTDSSGNSSSSAVTVTVPKNRQDNLRTGRPTLAPVNLR